MFTDLYHEMKVPSQSPTPAQQDQWRAYQQLIKAQHASPVAIAHPLPAPHVAQLQAVQTQQVYEPYPGREECRSAPLRMLPVSAEPADQQVTPDMVCVGRTCITLGDSILSHAPLRIQLDVRLEDIATIVIDGKIHSAATVKYAMREYLAQFK